MEFKKLLCNRNFNIILIFLVNFSKENELLKEKVGNYEKKLINYSAETQELQKTVKQLTLERDHFKGMSMKYQIELADQDRILNISLSPLKRPQNLNANLLEFEFDYVESDILHV